MFETPPPDSTDDDKSSLGTATTVAVPAAGLAATPMDVMAMGCAAPTARVEPGAKPAAPQRPPQSAHRERPTVMPHAHVAAADAGRCDAMGSEHGQLGGLENGTERGYAGRALDRATEQAKRANYEDDHKLGQMRAGP